MATNNKKIIITVIIFFFVVAGMFALAFWERTSEDGPVGEVTEETDGGPYDAITTINAKHFFIDGEHTIAGEINMPTQCDLLNWNPIIMETDPEQVRIDFEIINNSDTCAQVVTPQRFKVSFKASEAAHITATLAGHPVTLNLIPPAQGETPDEFELFIKG